MYLLNLIIIFISVSSGFANNERLGKIFQFGSSNQLMGTVRAEGYDAIQELNSLSSNNRITSQLNSEILNANKKIERIPRSLLRSELKDKSVKLETVIECKNIYSSESEEVENECKTDNQMCSNTAQNDVRTINRHLQSYTNDITKEIQNLSQVNNRCYRFLRPFSSASCVTQEIRSIQSSIKSNLNNGRMIARENDNKFKDILDKNTECINTNVKTFKNKMELVVKKICNCILKDGLITTKATVATESTKATVSAKPTVTAKSTVTPKATVKTTVTAKSTVTPKTTT